MCVSLTKYPGWPGTHKAQLSISRLLGLQECGIRVDLVVLEIHLFTNMRPYVWVSLWTALCGSKCLHTLSRSRGLCALLHHSLHIPLERVSPWPRSRFSGGKLLILTLLFLKYWDYNHNTKPGFQLYMHVCVIWVPGGLERNLDPPKMNYKSQEPPCRYSEQCS